MNSNDTIICNLHNYTNIIIEGKDTIKFLQGQLSCDMDKIADKQNGYGVYCNTKGRILSFFDILHFNEKVILNLPSSVADIMIITLKKYAVFSKVSISKDETLSTFGIYGKDSLKWINQSFDSLVIEKNRLSYQNKIIAYRTITTEPAFKVIGEPKVLLNNISQGIYTRDLKEDHLNWKYFLISENLPEITINSSELYLPAELGLDKTSAISFNKGCFMGQEIVARMKYIGSMKKELKKIKIEKQNNINIKDKILSENKPVGEIVDFVSIHQQTFHALALLSNNVNRDSKNLVTAEGGTVSLF
jgi:folate-binding protein YgfZ